MARGLTRVVVLVLVALGAGAWAAATAEDAVPMRADRAALQATVERLANKVLDAQIKENKKYIPPLQWAQMAGTWKSAVHFNFHGTAALQWVRRNFGVDDSNMFVTTWILDALLTAQDLGGVPVPSAVVERTVEALLQFQDKNRPGSNVYSFWTQSKVKDAWMAAPENLNKLLETEGAFAHALHTFLHALHMDATWEKIAPLLDFPKEFVKAFRIPADADDSSCAMAMGAQLLRAADRYPAAAKKWAAANSDAGMQKFAATLQKYAYKPFSGDANAASIDPRTYYYLHDMLSHNVSHTDTDFAVVTTWMANIAEARHGFESGVAMPFNVNNLDASVSANTLCGTTLRALADLDKARATWFDATMQKLYTDTSLYVAWSVEKDIVTTRPDLLFMYYPPTYDVYMFMARTLQALEAAGDAAAKVPAMATVKARFASALRGAGTEQMLAAMSADTQDGVAVHYWDDFLGDADKVFGKPVKHGDDRLFTTSVVVNALLDAWTRPAAHGAGRAWLASTPARVREAVAGAVQFLHGGFNSFELRRDNAFFSGSVKVAHDFPFSFPSNVNQYLNGTHVDPQGPNPDAAINAHLLSAMNGVVSDAEFDAMLAKTWYGNKPPATFPGYNAQNGGLIYWSSRPLTEAFGVLALTKAAHLE